MFVPGPVPARSSNPFRHLRIRVTKVTPERVPSRRLRVDVALENTGKIPGVLLSTWAEARFEPGGVIATGPLLQQQHALEGHALLPAGGSASGVFVLPISSEILDAVEGARSGDVLLYIEGRLVVAPLLSTVKPSRPREGRAQAASAGGAEPARPILLGAPYETLGGGQYNTHMVGMTIAKSDWIRHLASWRWSEIELFEIALTNRSEHAQYRQVYDYLRQAQQSYREGDFRATLAHAHASLESLAKTVGNGSVPKGYEQIIAARVKGDTMRTDLGKVIRALNDLSHAGRHARPPEEEVTRADALLVLRMTLGLLERLG